VATADTALRLTVRDLDDQRLTVGLTVREVARRYRVGTDKVRAWIRSGSLKAVNTAAHQCAKARFVIVPEALAEFERGRAAAAPPKPQRRRRQPAGLIDFFPND
jgi:excisionase family DNA binding protein